MAPSNTSLRPHSVQVAPHLVHKNVHIGDIVEMDDKLTYRQQVAFCGKTSCRKCREGTGHGPYWYSYQVVDGRTIRTYIGKNLPPGVHAPTSQKSPVASDPATLQLANLSNARRSLSREIDELNRSLATDPTNEEAIRRLMIALLRSKRRGEALRAYQRFASVLQDGYNREPSPETQVVYKAVQRGDDFQYGRLEESSSLQDEREAADIHDEPTRDEVSRAQQEVQIGRTNQSPLVGRKNELDILRQLLLTIGRAQRTHIAGQKRWGPGITSLALETQHPQCMVLVGDEGIGKTRLAEEAAREAQRNGWAVVWSYIYAQESGIPYRLWTEALRRVIDQNLWRERDAVQRSHVFQPLEALLPEIRDFLTPDGASEEIRGDRERNSSDTYIPPEQEQLRLWEAVYELLTTVSARMPLMIVLDDVQWADASSCDLFGYLARRLQGHPIVLLMTCRENELPLEHPLRLLLAHMQREHAVELLHVRPLTNDQVGALVAHLPQLMVQQIQAQVAGNPFFAEELAHSFRSDGGALAEIREDSSQPLPGGATALPGTITAALNQRLNRLSGTCQQLLSKAAVLGGSFGFHLLSALEAGSTSADEDVLLDLLEEALRSGILREEGTGTRITYHFWHPLLANHLYNQLSATRRARLHRRAAEALHQVYATRESELAAAITQHLVKGGAELASIAYYAELAGNHAYGLSAYPEAERYYRLAVEYMEKVHPEGLQGFLLKQERLHLAFLLERLAECTSIKGDFKEARSLFNKVLHVRTLSRTSDSPVETQQEAQIQALLWCEIGWTWRFTGDNVHAQQCCARGEQVLRSSGISSGPAWARLRFQQGSIHWQQGNYEEAQRAAQEALKLFEVGLYRNDATAVAQDDIPATSSLTRIKRTLLGDPVDLGRTHTLLGAIANAIGQHTQALEHLNTALAIYERYDRQREIAHVSCNIGYVHLKKAEYVLARSFLDRSFNLAERIGDIPLMSVVFHNLGELAASSDDLREAETMFRRSLVLAERVEDREYLSRWNADLANVLQAQGKLVEAAACVGRALTIGRSMHNMPCVGHALVALGNLRIAQANEAQARGSVYLSRARGSLQRALALQGLEVETRANGQLMLARVCLLTGERETARKEALQAMEEARKSELVGVLKDCKLLLREIENSSS